MRNLLLLFVLTAILMTAVSCGKGKETITGDSQTADELSGAEETVDMSFTAELPDANFNGAVFTFLVQNDPCFRHLYDINTDEVNGDNINDAVYERNRTVEERYGVTITDVKDPNAEKAIYNAVASGDNSYSGGYGLRLIISFLRQSTALFIDLHKNSQHKPLKALLGSECCPRFYPLRQAVRYYG